MPRAAPKDRITVAISSSGSVDRAQQQREDHEYLQDTIGTISRLSCAAAALKCFC